MNKKTINERFWEKVNILEKGDCWNWTASLRNKWGYGGFNVGRTPEKKTGKIVVASRYAYILTFGEIPSESMVCHTCDNPLCCNPNHLYLGTNKSNTADKVRRGRSMRGHKHPSGKTSKFVGVSYKIRGGVGKWEAFIKVNMKRKYLGRFDAEVIAALAYNNAALLYFGKNAILNIIED